MNKITSSKFYPWLVVALLWVVALLNYMDRQMLSTMRDAMQIDIAELESAVNFGRLMKFLRIQEFLYVHVYAYIFLNLAIKKLKYS